MVAERRKFDNITCADCDSLMHNEVLYRGSTIVGKASWAYYSTWWWLCEACALARGWIW